jgi:hypothetical protein
MRVLPLVACKVLRMLGKTDDPVVPNKAGVAGDLGYSEAAICRLIESKGHSITSRYVHTADAVLLAAVAVIILHFNSWPMRHAIGIEIGCPSSALVGRFGRCVG